MTFADTLGLMLYIVGGGAITAALICIMTDWEGIEYPGALLFAGIVIGFIGFWFRTGTSIQGAVGLLFYFISLLCFIGVWLNLLLGGSGGIAQAEAANKTMWVFGVCCIIFWFLGWLARSVVFV